MATVQDKIKTQLLSGMYKLIDLILLLLFNCTEVLPHSFDIFKQYLHITGTAQRRRLLELFVIGPLFVFFY